MAKVVWTAAKRRAFAAKMKRARAAKRGRRSATRKTTRTAKRNPSRSRRKSTYWTPQRRAAFAKRMQAARRGVVKYGGKAVRAAAGGTWAALKAGASEARRQLKNPRRGTTGHFCLIAKKGGRTLNFDGNFFSSKRKVRRFSTQAAAAEWARYMLRTYPVLKSYQLYVKAA